MPGFGGTQRKNDWVPLTVGAPEQPVVMRRSNSFSAAPADGGSPRRPASGIFSFTTAAPPPPAVGPVSPGTASGPSTPRLPPGNQRYSAFAGLAAPPAAAPGGAPGCRVFVAHPTRPGFCLYCALPQGQHY